MVIDDHLAGSGRCGPSAAAGRIAKPKDPDAPVVLEGEALTKSFWLRSGVFGRKRVPGRARA